MSVPPRLQRLLDLVEALERKDPTKVPGPVRLEVTGGELARGTRDWPKELFETAIFLAPVATAGHPRAWDEAAALAERHDLGIDSRFAGEIPPPRVITGPMARRIWPSATPVSPLDFLEVARIAYARLFDGRGGLCPFPFTMVRLESGRTLPCPQSANPPVTARALTADAATFVELRHLWLTGQPPAACRSCTVLPRVLARRAPPPSFAV